MRCPLCSPAIEQRKERKTEQEVRLRIDPPCFTRPLEENNKKIYEICKDNFDPATF